MDLNSVPSRSTFNCGGSERGAACLRRRGQNPHVCGGCSRCRHRVTLHLPRSSLHRIDAAHAAYPRRRSHCASSSDARCSRASCLPAVRWCITERLSIFPCASAVVMRRVPGCAIHGRTVITSAVARCLHSAVVQLLLWVLPCAAFAGGRWKNLDAAVVDHLCFRVLVAAGGNAILLPDPLRIFVCAHPAGLTGRLGGAPRFCCSGRLRDSPRL
jgi:hypothetical protein